MALNVILAPRRLLFSVCKLFSSSYLLAACFSNICKMANGVEQFQALYLGKMLGAMARNGQSAWFKLP